MDVNLADSLLELDAEDLSEIYHMVSEWEFNFGSLEVSVSLKLFVMPFLFFKQTSSQHNIHPWYRDRIMKNCVLLCKLIKPHFCLAHVKTT